MSLPLEGIRVIDLTQYQQGPYCTQMLGDMGARVIKVEPRGTGDPGRRIGPWGRKGTSAYFEAHNRHKKSITVDARTEKGKEIIYRLVEKSDIFAQNFRPGVAERLGFGYEALSRINPRIIYLTASAYGLKGPLAKKPGFDGIGQAMSGILSTILSPEGMANTVIGTAVSDQTGAILLAFGAMVALFHRERTGQGQEVDTSLLGSTMALVGWTFQCYLTSGKEPQVSRARITSLGLTSSHVTKDGKGLLFHILGRENQVKCFKLMGLDRLATDPRFESGEKMMENREALLAAMDEAIRTKDRDDWLRRFDEADIVAAPIHNLAEAAAHPQAIANEFVVEIDHPKEGPMRVLGVPVKLHKTPGRVGLTPELGQHTGEVLSGIAGYTAEEIAQMREQEII
jgi:crotonobetainyl-CoA:carnitine CoA-transferase CaiB-like acyl-CoA transferase